MSTLARFTGLAVVATFAMFANSSHALGGVQGTVTEVWGGQYFNFTVNENNTPVKYYTGTGPCTTAGAGRFLPSMEEAVLAAFKEGWKIRVEYLVASNGTKCAQTVWISK